MPLQVACPYCNTSFLLAENLTGKSVPLVYAVCGGAALVVSLFGLRRDLREFLVTG